MANLESFLPQLIHSLQTAGVQKTYAKAQYLLRAGETEKNLYFIVSGAVRIFLPSAHEEHTIRLGYEGSIINSLASFLTGQPSEFYVEAIRKTVVNVISKEQVIEISQASTASLKAYNNLLETVITQQMEREVDLLTASPTERLQRVLKRSPHLFQQVPLKYIASYLRMSPETLSRIRNS
ncbi:Crp/Fnr family transcriptional regulator [Pedobacter sp. ASV12]|uniref:Crp/Fnr family transcriptional regulator n=1 Tax=Pedobacter sp. ASV12 TaxID=2795120 RepID=UPI0018EDE0A4|nr:Crp/Fnr family transcriptional regulator [Pedobacter sp. ASV12]